MCIFFFFYCKNASSNFDFSRIFCMLPSEQVVKFDTIVALPAVYFDKNISQVFTFLHSARIGAGFETFIHLSLFYYCYYDETREKWSKIAHFIVLTDWFCVNCLNCYRFGLFSIFALILQRNHRNCKTIHFDWKVLVLRCNNNCLSGIKIWFAVQSFEFSV